MWLLFNVLVLLPKGEQKKKGRGKFAGLLNVVGIISAQGERLVTIEGGAATMLLPFCLNFCDQKHPSVIREQIASIWCIGSFLPILVPIACMLWGVG